MMVAFLEDIGFVKEMRAFKGMIVWGTMVDCFVDNPWICADRVDG